MEVEMFERDKGQVVEPGGASAFLGKGTKITGKLLLNGPGRIEGHVEGEITAEDTLTIGESAVVNARITGTTIIVQGQVTGDITAKTRLEIHSPSKVQGNINTPSLVIADGAIFEGQCSMGGTEATRPAKGRKGSDIEVPPPVSAAAH
jgi:cytoskeletal protein CcmA (bactofilin family)